MITAAWKKLASTATLRRSSQTVSVIGRRAYVFGGELRPREPVDGALYACSVSQSMWFAGLIVTEGCANSEASDQGSHISQVNHQSASPQPRVGSAATALAGKLYMFSGRGGVEMAPIEENGSIWCFDPSSNFWSLIDPANRQLPFPEGRSYHAMTSDGESTIYVHAGCPEKGRLGDLWSFSLSTRKWTELPSAPDPARGGASVAFSERKLWRLNGFDGKTEQGGNLDVFDPKDNAWTSIQYPTDGKQGPSPRSVSCLLAINVQGRHSLLTGFGEGDPSNLGHQGAGRMLDDVWLYDIASSSWQLVAAQNGTSPPPRGWFAADTVGDSEVLVQGGLSPSNERLDDLWLLSFGALDS